MHRNFVNGNKMWFSWEMGFRYSVDGAKSVKITNMLEEEQGEVESIAPAKLQFRPFEIKTLKVTY